MNSSGSCEAVLGEMMRKYYFFKFFACAGGGGRDVGVLVSVCCDVNVSDVMIEQFQKSVVVPFKVRH